jgi:hypothetical protein
MLAFVTTWQQAALLITIERTGKALRGPARDLLLSEATGKVGHGFGFGVHAVMDQTGALRGAALMGILAAKYGHVGPAFAWLAIPAALALLSILLARAVRPVQVEPPAAKPGKAMPAVFWPYVAAAALVATGFIDFPGDGRALRAHADLQPGDDPAALLRGDGDDGPHRVHLRPLVSTSTGLSVLAYGIALSAFALPLGFMGGATSGVIAVLLWASGSACRMRRCAPASRK